MSKQLLLSVLYLFSIPQAFSQITWQKHRDNPVVSSGPSSSEDPKHLRFAYTPSVLHSIPSVESASDIYRMWFSSLTPGGGSINLSYAISMNGKDWFLYSKNPVMKTGTGSAFDSRWITNADVIYVNNQFQLYYTGHDGSRWQTGMAISTDGINWKKHEANPILRTVSGGWESVAADAGKVIYNGSSYVMIYTGFDGAAYAIGLATSSDGVRWTRHTANPVMRRGSPGAWDQNSVISMGLFFASGRYYLLYGGGPGTAIGLATSTDLINWTRYANNPVLQPQPGTWENKIEFGSVLLEGQTVHFWYSGNAPGDIWQIGYATSPFTPQLFDDSAASNAAHAVDHYSLEQANPNPFNPETQIHYTVPVAERVVITIVDALGREIQTIVNQDQPPGRHFATWNASNYASGVYFYRMKAGNFTEMKKMILTK